MLQLEQLVLLNSCYPSSLCTIVVVMLMGASIHQISDDPSHNIAHHFVEVRADNHALKA